ncbi:hypothetical protein IWX90DRAFT_428528 [Phyllosticta citrichinensis]|uniref:Secreted protein n=1 Tax=Phyllosticta citrichinensis TaxID=1130410 RepID=A0ABR1Y089_9PEZI
MHISRLFLFLFLFLSLSLSLSLSSSFCSPLARRPGRVPATASIQSSRRATTVLLLRYRWNHLAVSVHSATPSCLRARKDPKKKCHDSPACQCPCCPRHHSLLSHEKTHKKTKPRAKLTKQSLCAPMPVIFLTAAGCERWTLQRHRLTLPPP